MKRNHLDWPVQPAKYPLSGPSSGLVFTPAPRQVTSFGDIAKVLGKIAKWALIYGVIALFIGTIGAVILLAFAATRSEH